jgi:plasmid stabilization system protein ParE
MSYRVVITERALSDLTQIRDFIAKRSPINAAKFLEKLLRQFDVMERSPEGFGRAPEDALVPYTLHQIVVKPYRILYRVSGTSIQILHVRHGARQRA